jgi:lipid-A-disaccharide synthase-like uncharacterized protein
MGKTDALTRVLAVVGTVLAWLPLVAPFLFSAMFLVQARQLRFDYLMPAEFFPLALLGGALLLWAGLRARSRVRLIGAALAMAAALLLGVQAFAQVSGLASGAVEAVGWRWAVVLLALAGYSLALVAVGVGGVLLLRDVFAAQAQT